MPGVPPTPASFTVDSCIEGKEAEMSLAEIGIRKGMPTLEAISADSGTTICVDEWPRVRE